MPGIAPGRRSTDDPAGPALVAAQMRAIVEARNGRIEGKWKMKQNRLPVEREGVVRGLRSVNDPHRNSTLAAIMERRDPRSTTAQDRRWADVGNARSKRGLLRS